jgi:uncharacterized protein
MLSVNIRHIEQKDALLKGELPVAKLDLDLHDEMMQANTPLKYDLKVEKLHDSLLVTGSLRLVLDCECVRCLKPFKLKLELPGWAYHLPLEGEDQVSIDNDCVDLTPYIREDMLLEFPQHPVCKPDCQGLKKKSKVAKPEVQPDLKPSAWSELDKLKL